MLCYYVDMKYNLPKGYLSFSSMQLWKQNKDNFRKKYYEETDTYNLDTVYTRFGKKIAEMMEDPKIRDADPVLKKIPTYKVSEHPIDIEVDGVPIKAFLDSFCPKRKAILEYKTGIKKDGKPAWDQLKVQKWDQLPLYSLLVKEKYGKVTPTVKLVWMETEWAPTQRPQVGLMEEVWTPDLQLTGRVEVFKRKIEEWEHLRMRIMIKKIAEEISEDYGKYKQASNHQ